MPQASRSANVTRMLLDVTEDLRRFVHDDVERAIAVVQAQERRRGSQEDCFSTVAGTFLRYRCCVYYSALTAALMEARFGAVSSSSATHGLVTPYGALARWLLQPPAGVPDVAVAHASQLMAEADASNDGSYDLATLRRAAAQLPGPLGRYATRLSIRGVGGTLWRCELLTAHTYLVFVADEPGVDDVIVDVSFKQFLVVPEWMAAADFEVPSQRFSYPTLTLALTFNPGPSPNLHPHPHSNPDPNPNPRRARPNGSSLSFPRLSWAPPPS